MTTTEGNKIIAEFMGAKPGRPLGKRNCYNGVPSISWTDGAIRLSTYFDDSLCFHCSFDWLMPVVEKIEQLNGCYFFRIHGCTVSVDNTDILYNCPPADFGLNATSKINAVWLAVVSFLHWYSKQSKSDV